MTRGNQRDMARAKAAKKDKGSTKAANEQKGNEGLSKEQRMQRDADRMREKQKAKEAAAQAGAAGGKKWYIPLATSDISCQKFLSARRFTLKLGLEPLRDNSQKYHFAIFNGV